MCINTSARAFRPGGSRLLLHLPASRWLPQDSSIFEQVRVVRHRYSREPGRSALRARCAQRSFAV